MATSRTEVSPYADVLWSHQLEAVRLIERYLDDGPKGSALVHMPTGGGKSGVITVVARCVVAGDVVALTPRTALRRQLKSDIQAGFFEQVGLDNNRDVKPVHELLPSNLRDLLRTTKNTPAVFVSTFQALMMIRREDPVGYRDLRNRLALVMADEGHYEPGTEWSATVRSLQTPTVLFSATPYRNDIKAFNINHDYVSSYSVHDGIGQHRLRSVKFSPLPSTTSAAEFVESLLTFYHGSFKQLSAVKFEDAKVIIRCKSLQSVTAVGVALAAKGADFVALHERLEATKDPTYPWQRHVPNPRERDTTFWVHQFKLMEGIDDPRFALLAFFEPLTNSRAIVQQIGRVIRNRTGKRETADVLVDPATRVRDQWESYLRFERQPIDNALRTSLETLYEAQPTLAYLLGEFRQVFDPDDIDPTKELLVRRSARIYRVQRNFELGHLDQAVLKHASDRDRLVMRTWTLDAETTIHVWVAQDNSPILATRSFVELELGYTLYRRNGEFLFYSDSQNAVPDYVARRAFKVPGHTLKRLYPHDRTNRVIDLSLMNSDLGGHAIRSKSIRAYDLATVASALSDYAHFPSTARAVIDTGEGQRGRRRYVGFSRARVTDETPRCTVDIFTAWVDEIASELRRRTSSAPAFSRFAELAEPPPETDARNILLDLDDVLEEYETTALFFDTEREKLSTDSLCMDIDAGSFEAEFNGRPFPIRISFDADAGRYELTSDELDFAFAPRRTKTRLLSHLNAEQSFRVVPESAGFIYAHGQWYRPRISKSGDRGDLWHDLLSVFEAEEELALTTSEKGEACRRNGAGWQRKSLFHFADTRGRGTTLEELMSGFDVLICDDMMKEVADFIGVSTTQDRAVLMHLKAYGDQGRTRSASAFAEVCSQAVKNLDYLSPFGDREPPNINHWANAWTAPGVRGHVNNRIRTRQKPERAWELFRNVVRKPAATREVWVMMGHGFSLGAFEGRIENDVLTPEDLQIMYLVRSTWHSVASMGARFRVLCSP